MRRALLSHLVRTNQSHGFGIVGLETSLRRGPRNTPFQGLAADGAKLALWGLYRAGFRAVAFVHDKGLIELPINADHTEAAKRIDRILCETMEELAGSIPIACEFALSDRWYKAAEAVFNSLGELQKWNPK